MLHGSISLFTACLENVMCGIAGFINADQTQADREILARMTSTLHRRGPDGFGHWTDGPAALGHRRLSIIDLAGGAQPMSNEDGSIWVTFNGEIYNEPALRKSLIERGHQFQTLSDTECLVHLYEEHGPDFVKQLNGMFALAIWDIPLQRLTLARDRMGQKPLYWSLQSNGLFAFASEPKALLKHPEFRAGLNTESLSKYLFYEYLPYENSMWEGVQKLRPGHLLVFENHQTRLERYWQSPVSHPLINQKRSDQDSLPAEFWNRFRGAVESHSRADVPLGVFLSGGVDSSAVAAALVELEGPERVRTFSIGFEDQSFDESSHARLVANHLGTQHHERIFSAETLIDLLPNVSEWLDEPFGDASLLPTHLLSKFAREQVTVALGGDGADELMSGYPTFTAEPWLHMFQRLPRPARSIIASIVDRMPVRHSNFSLDFKARQFLRGADCEPPLAHQRWLGSFSGAELEAILVEPPEFQVEAEMVRRVIGDTAHEPDDSTRRLLQYQETYLPEDILFKVDRASMAASLEVRAPFLDADLVDWLATLPYQVKRQGGVGKHLLKQALRDRLPSRIMNRPKKGFGIPVAAWLRGPLKNWMTDLLGQDRLNRQGLFRPEPVSRLVDEHIRGVRDHRKPIWTLLSFQIWYDQWINHRN